MTLFNPEELASFLEQWRHTGLLPFLVVGLYIVGTVLFIPVVVLFLVTAYLLTPLQCAAASMAGIVSSAFVGYLIGRAGGHKILARMPKKIIGKIRSKMSGQEILSVAVIRKIPIAPYIVVNMVLGAIGIPPVSFAVGTALGMLPAVVLVSIFDKSYETAMANPGPKTIALSVGLTVSVLVLSYYAPIMVKRFKRAPWSPPAARR